VRGARAQGAGVKPKTDALSGLTASALIVVGLALIGLLAGTRETGYAPVLPSAAARIQQADQGVAQPARSYTELMTHGWGAGPSHADTVQRALRVAAPTRVLASDADARAAALAKRAEQRAYAGAPPTIPHPIAQSNGRECRTCHNDGGMFGATLVPARSHPQLEQCTQCHVPERSEVPPSQHTFAVPSGFEPLLGAPAPSRWSMAPPQMPHSSFMRERCETCHGAFGRPGLQTSHPERQNCLQCHAPAGALEQMPVAP
jgi:nitrate reductase (cytochrome), electron transfer subunit